MGVGHFVDLIRIGADGQPYQNATVSTVYRPSAIVTTSYVAGNAIDTWKYSQAVVLWGTTLGSLTSHQIKIEWSPDNVTWYQETFEAISAGTATSTAGEHTTTATPTGALRIAVPIADRYMRVSAKGTGTVTSSLCLLDVYLGIN